MTNTEDRQSAIDLERELAQLTMLPQRGNSKHPAATNAVMEQCLKAADLIRAIPDKEINTGEDVARQLEEIGHTFLKRLTELGGEFQASCQKAAEELRKLRAVPQEQAEETADKLLKIGQSEAERHAGVVGGLMDMRTALKRIDDIAKGGNGDV